MKKVKTLIWIVTFGILLIGCSKKTMINLPFDVANIDNVEMYQFVVPAAAEKMTVTETDDIHELYTMFANLSVSDKKTEPVLGGKTTSFRFNLNDGTSYEMIYCAETTKSGRVLIPDEKLDYFTSADIGGCWDSYKYEVVSVKESELPSLK